MAADSLVFMEKVANCKKIWYNVPKYGLEDTHD